MKKLLLSTFVFLAIGTVATAQQAPKKAAEKEISTTPLKVSEKPSAKQKANDQAKLEKAKIAQRLENHQGSRATSAADAEKKVKPSPKQ